MMNSKPDSTEPDSVAEIRERSEQIYAKRKRDGFIPAEVEQDVHNALARIDTLTAELAEANKRIEDVLKANGEAEDKCGIYCAAIEYIRKCSSDHLINEIITEALQGKSTWGRSDG